MKAINSVEFKFNQKNLDKGCQFTTFTYSHDILQTKNKILIKSYYIKSLVNLSNSQHIENRWNYNFLILPNLKWSRQLSLLDFLL